MLLVLTSIASYAQISKVEIVATGLTCSMCSNAINKQLKALPEVASVATDLNANSFTVEFKQGTTVSPLRLKQSVEKAGFFVGSMIITLNLENPNLDENWSTSQNTAKYVFVDAESKKVNQVVKAKVLDKGFVTPKEYKKIAKSLAKYATFNSGEENTFHLKLS